MMAFTGLGNDDRLNPSRFRRSDPPNPDALFSFQRQPLPTIPTVHAPQNSTAAAAFGDAKGNAQRRFTTSSSFASPFAMRRPAEEPPVPDIPLAFQQRVSPGDKKKAEYEYLRQKHAQRQAQLEQLSREHELGELALRQFSAAPNDRDQAYHTLTSGQRQSLPQSERVSDVGDTFEEVRDLNHKSAASVNRKSMPVTGRDHRVQNGVSDSASTLGHVNTHAFLFGDEDRNDTTPTMSNHSSRPVSFFQTQNADQFPVLLRHDGNGNTSGVQSPQGNDLASAGHSEPSSAPGSKRVSYRRSLPPGANGHQLADGDSPPYGFTSSILNDNLTATAKNSAINRHSYGAPLTAVNESKRPGLIGSPANVTEAPKLQSSYSTSDIPTINNPGASANGYTSPPIGTQTAEQRLHNHNASLGRIPPSARNSNRHSRELSAGGDSQLDDNPAFESLQAILANRNPTSSAQISAQASAQRPSTSAVSSAGRGNVTSPIMSSSVAGPESIASPNMYHPYAQTQQFHVPGSYPAPNQMNMLTSGMGGMAMNGQALWNGVGQGYGQPYQAAYNNNDGGYQTFSPGRGSDTSSRGQSSRRGPLSDDTSRFTNVALADLQGEIYSLCKDQNGCRYLQKKLEENIAGQTQMIFDETKEHMVDLMTDPFGNYLCQKLLENTGPAEHTVLINNAAPDMVRIALNQHGTRALQKMIEYVTSVEQIQTLILALKDQVVPMIQDLNGNHVIQKCLNYLEAQDVQFVIDAISGHCVVVGTHRHGCCVIQRCIDHANGEQKAQLITAIINHSFPLVQDPFGNYVLQYIFDQNEEAFSQHLCRTFLGNITNLSRQKFSSNVIEKCIRIADADTRHLMIEEIVNSPDFERLADDPFANYVVQTAWNEANPEDEVRIAECMRPILPRMRNKPYGKRFLSRMTERDRRFGITVMPPNDSVANQMTSPMSSLSDTSFYQQTDGHTGNLSQMTSPAYSPAPLHNAHAYNHPSSHRMSNAGYPNMGQYQNNQMHHQQQYNNGYGRGGYGMSNGYGMGMNGMNNQHY